METDINLANTSQSLPQTNQVPNQPIVEPMNNKLVKVLLFVVGAVVFMAIGAFGYSSYLKLTTTDNLKSNNNTNINPTSFTQPSITPVTTTPVPTTANNNSLKSYDAKFITLQYPSSWYVWSYGRGVSLDYFQINSVSQSNEQNADRAIIAFDIQALGYTEGQTLEEQKNSIEGFKNQNPDQNYIISQRNIDGVSALVYERTIANTPSYEKTVWVRKNNVKYIVTLTVFGKTIQSRDLLTSQVKPDFENILNSIKLKYVDPAEVEKLGNHPD